MDFDRYCKHCGTKVEFEYGKITSVCSCCNKEISRAESIAGHTRNARINQLKAMHQLMLEANDEAIYMSWIYTVPDEPSEEDFSDIAIDDEQYNYAFDKFVKLIAYSGNRY